MTGAEMVRRRLPVGVAGFLRNLLCWGIVLLLSPRIDQNPFPHISEADWQSFRFELGHCWDCPTFSLFGKQFGSIVLDPVPATLVLLANLPALWLAAGPEGALGIRPLNPLVLLLVSSSQWFLLGAGWRAWRRWRLAKHHASVVEA
jgi:hypothetical protein